MRKAYVLIRAEAGSTEEIARTLRSKCGVKAADVVSGPYDVITLVEGAQAEDVARIALIEIPDLEGIKCIETCLVHKTEDGATQDNLSIRRDYRCEKLY